MSSNGVRVVLIDWEHSAVRMRDYDRLVFRLQTRPCTGLARRLRRSAGPLARELSWEAGQVWPQLALFLLEDLVWFSDESLIGPTLCISAGLVQYERELSLLGPDLASA